MDPQLIEKLSSQGVLGLVAAIFLVLTLWLGRALLIEKDKRIDDSKEDAKILTVTLDKVEGTLSALKIAIEKDTNHDKHT
jgi:hypothetical protein